NARETPPAGELLSCLCAVHREEESPAIDQRLCGVPAEVANRWACNVGFGIVRRRAVTGNCQLSTFNSQSERARASAGLRAVRRIAGLLRIGKCIRACQHDGAMGIGCERSDRVSLASDRIEPLWMCTRVGEWQRIYF